MLPTTILTLLLSAVSFQGALALPHIPKADDVHSRALSSDTTVAARQIAKAIEAIRLERRSSTPAPSATDPTKELKRKPSREPTGSKPHSSKGMRLDVKSECDPARNHPVTTTARKCLEALQKWEKTKNTQKPEGREVVAARASMQCLEMAHPPNTPKAMLEKPSTGRVSLEMWARSNVLEISCYIRPTRAAPEVEGFDKMESQMRRQRVATGNQNLKPDEEYYPTGEMHV